MSLGNSPSARGSLRPWGARALTHFSSLRSGAAFLPQALWLGQELVRQQPHPGARCWLPQGAGQPPPAPAARGLRHLHSCWLTHLGPCLLYVWPLASVGVSPLF